MKVRGGLVFVKPMSGTVNLTVNVSWGCIVTGIAGSCRKCPIALALKAVGFTDVAVNPRLGVICRTSDLIWMHGELPSKALAFMSRFDGEEDKITPFKFDLELNSIPNGRMSSLF